MTPKTLFLGVLAERGWQVAANLTYPWAINPQRTVKLWVRRDSLYAGPVSGGMNESKSLGWKFPDYDFEEPSAEEIADIEARALRKVKRYIDAENIID